MEQKQKYTYRTIIYLINKLGSKIEGKKKIMKLMFLLEHFDFDQNKLVKKGFLGNLFYIYNYGVFSQSVMGGYMKLIEDNIIKDGFPLTTDRRVDLGGKLKEKVDKVISKFGSRSGYELEVGTLKMMNIEPYEKEKYFGQDVGELISS